jgi:hypothetical protein
MFSFYHEVSMQKVADPGVIFSAENWPVFDRIAGRLHIGIRISG